VGYLRFLLAIGVLIHHTKGVFSIMNGGLAVEIFFSISGFYMAMVYERRYAGRPFIFYKNRLLRLLPTYYIALTIQILLLYLYDIGAEASKEDWAQVWNTNATTAWTFTIFNAIPFGQEWLSFISLNSDYSISFTKNTYAAIEAWRFLMMPQSWSISIEILFYLCVPLLTRSKSILITLAAISLLGHTLTIFNDLGYSTWGRRFFPTLIHFFALGMLSFYIGGRNKEWIQQRSKSFAWALLLMIPLFTIALRTPNEFAIKYGYPITSIYAAAILPIISLKIKSNIEEYLGQLSYPIYMTHLTVLTAVSHTLKIPGYPTLALSIALTIIISALIHKFIEAPIETMRQQNIGALKNE
jgi:peptidoglycan/LPS O-acetylase OafA/YrhL